MRWKYHILFLIFLFISISSLEMPIVAGVAPVTSAVTTDVFDLDIRVVTTPSLVIVSPENGTYLINESLVMAYNVSDDAFQVWYVLDGSSPVTLSTSPSSIYFNASEGSHLIQMYANNTANLTEREVRFISDPAKFTIHYKSRYKTGYSGESTDFYYHTFEELQNLSDVCLENVNYGKICFSEPINITDDRINSDNYIDIENHTFISENLLGVDSYELPNFNVSATLQFYNLQLENPRVLKNGRLCYSPCTIDDYSVDGTLTFRVDSFSNYSVEETPISQVVVIGESSSGGGGGGGGGGSQYFCGRVINETLDSLSEKINETIDEIYCGRCNPPYMMRGKDCCLDKDQNRICDVDELSDVVLAKGSWCLLCEVDELSGTRLEGWCWLDIILMVLVLVLLLVLVRLVSGRKRAGRF